MNNDLLKKAIKMAAKSNGRCVDNFIEAVGGEDSVLELLEKHPWEHSFAHNFKQGEKFMEANFGELMEDNGGISASATAVFSLLGVTAGVVGAYDLPNNFMGTDCCYVEPSKTFQEPKAWLYRPDLPELLEDMQEPSESGFYPRSLVVTNSDRGKAWKISRRAIDDDQVGQFARIPAQIGEGHRNEEEIYFSGFLYGQNFTTNGITVSVPIYNDPDGTNGLYVETATSDRRNAIASAAISQNAIQDLITVSKAIKDPGGKTLLIRPSILWGGTDVSFNAAAILNSTFWPSAMTGAATPTVTGTFSTVNPLDPKWGVLRSPLDYKEQPYFNGTNDIATGSSKKLWGLMDPKKNGIIMQNRQPLEVLMEAPNAGGSIRTRSYYYRTYRRYAYYYGDSRFLFRGSNGSI